MNYVASDGMKKEDTPKLVKFLTVAFRLVRFVYRLVVYKQNASVRSTQKGTKKCDCSASLKSLEQRSILMLCNFTSIIIIPIIH